MQTSVAPSSHASRARRTTSSRGNRYPSSSRWSRLNAQKPQCLMQTFVKLMLRLTTYVTTSPTCRRRISSATSVIACRSRPAAPVSAMPSSTESSWPSRTPARMRRMSRDAESRVAERLPAAPVLMGFLLAAVAVHERGHARAQRLSQELRAHRELGIDREALAEDEAHALGGAAQLRDQRPRLLGVDVVGRERRDAAPVVEPRGEEAGVDPRREVRRRLDVHVGSEQEPADGDRAEQGPERRLGGAPHRNARPRADVLDDDFLEVTVPLLEVANRRERVHPLARCLTDADENACRERDRELARERDRAQAPRRPLVGGTVVRQAGAEQPLRDGLEHQAHAHGDLPKRGEVALGHDAWIGVGQERRLSERELADRAEIAERGAVAVAAQERAVDGKSRLGLVAEREKGLFRTETRARLSERDHLLGRHRVGAGLAGIA